MRNFFSSLFLLLVFFVILFAISGWYFNTAAERTFRAYLQSNSSVQTREIFRLELDSYKKTLFGAKAKLKMSSDIPFIAEKIGVIELQANLLNGPLFITKTGVNVGLSRWFVKLDESHLTDDRRENIRAIFPGLLPRLIIRTDFYQKIHYVGEIQTNYALINVQGIYDSMKKKNRGELQVKHFHYRFLQNQLMAESFKLQYQGEEIRNSAYKQGVINLHLNAPEVKITQENQPFISLDIVATGSVSQKDNNLNSRLNIKFEQRSHHQLPVEKGDFSLLIKGISSEGFFRYSKLQAELDNLRQQAQWSLQEAGEYPEGQDHIWQLYNKIDETSQQLPKVILSKMFDQESLISFNAHSFNSQGQSELLGQLKVVPPVKKYVKNRGGGFNGFLSLLQGEASVNLDDKLFRYLQDNMSNFLPLKQSQFKLMLKDTKLLMQ